MTLMSFSLNALGREVEIGREREAGDGVDLAVGEHGLAHRETDRFDFHLRVVDACFPFTKAFHCAKAPSGGGAPSTLPSRSFGLALIFDFGDTHDGERRLVIDHHHRFHVLVRVLVAEAHQRVDVEEADRIGAGRDAGDAGDRAGSGSRS
jgi:hypothetical protein